MLNARYVLTILVVMALGGVAGLLVGAIWGYAGREAGWWLAGLMLGLLYGVIGGFALAERA